MQQMRMLTTSLGVVVTTGAALLLGACLRTSSSSSTGSPEVGHVSSALSGNDGGDDGSTPACTPFSPCSIWSSFSAPAGSGSTTAVELGVKVQSTESGYITGIRFYKDDTTNPTHTVNLWDRSGNLLASAVSTGESTSGWQTVSFAQPVAVSASTTYVASYFMPGGMFPVDRPGFTSAVVNAPLEALADGQDGSNGVYAYGASSSFPTGSYNASNYWVDVVFSTTAPAVCSPSTPCSIWSAGAAPSGEGTTTSVELGVKVQSSEAGYITGIRFFKDDTNNSTHTVNLWTGAGTLLATATSTGESNNGWQSVTFAEPVAVSANTTYVASYLMPGGDFALDRPGFGSAVVNPPLEALADGQDGNNGLYSYGSTSTFPVNSLDASNYWVDVLFSTTTSRSCSSSSPCGLWTTTATPKASGTTTAVELGVKVQSSEAGYILGVRFYKADTNNSTHTVNLWDEAGNNLASAQTGSESTSGWQSVTFAQPVAVSAYKTYVASYFMPGGYFPFDRPGFTDALVNAPLEALADGQDGAGNGVYGYAPSSSFPNVSLDATNYWVDVLFSPTPRDCTPSSPCSIWSLSSSPASTGSTTSVELGVKLRSSEAGYITGVRFYKADTNPLHTVNLWDHAGNNLASANSTGESGSGWQTVSFAQPVAVSANTTYVASYLMPGGAFALDRPGLSSAVLNAPLEALADGQDGSNGVYSYGASSSFPTNGYGSSNYWVDALFSTTSGQSGGGDAGAGEGGDGAVDGGGGGAGIDAPLVNVTAVAAGGAHTCALISDGTVECWGDNEFGQLGNGMMMNSPTPVGVSGLSGVTAIAAGNYHTCALLSGGTVECWGTDQIGELGDGMPASQSSTPVPVSGLTGVAAITAGADQSCALLTGGTVECWGGNADGELGDGTSTGPSTCAGSNACSTTPAPVSGLSGVTAIAAGGGPQTCAVLSGGTVECWGYNGYGVLGDGTSTGPATCGGFPCSTVPGAVSGLTGVSAVAAGNLGTCALISGGTVQCWGDNTYGDLGTGSSAGPTFCNSTPCSTTPVAVSGLTGVNGLAAGYGGSCALLSDGTVECWGYNAVGELGNGNTTNSPSPVAVTGLSGVTAISRLFEHTCAVLTGGTVECWGYNHWGQLGNASTTDSSTPVLVGF